MPLYGSASKNFPNEYVVVLKDGLIESEGTYSVIKLIPQTCMHAGYYNLLRLYKSSFSIVFPGVVKPAAVMVACKCNCRAQNKRCYFLVVLTIIFSVILPMQSLIHGTGNDMISTMRGAYK